MEFLYSEYLISTHFARTQAPVQTETERTGSGHTSDAFTFAQVSDPHLTSLEGVRLSELLSKRLLGYLSWLKRRRHEHQRAVLDALVRDLHEMGPDHILITGDLTHIGLPAEVREARGWLETVAAPRDLTLIPGNHEAYASAGWDRAYQQWREYLASDEEASDPGAVFPSLRVRGPVAIIGLSSALPTPPFLATGRVGTRQLEALAPLLDETARRGLFRILLVHHSPAEGVHPWRKRLTDRAALARILQRHGAELVLHGHNHRTRWSELPGPLGPVSVISTPSGSAVGPTPARRASYHLYRLSVEKGYWRLSVEVRGYSPRDRRLHRVETREQAIPCATWEGSYNCLESD